MKFTRRTPRGRGLHPVRGPAARCVLPGSPPRCPVGGFASRAWSWLAVVSGGGRTQIDLLPSQGVRLATSALHNRLRLQERYAILAVCVVAALVYASLLQAPYLIWDDDLNVFENPFYGSGSGGGCGPSRTSG